MGITAQQILQSDPEYLRRQLAAQEDQRLNPQGTAAGALGVLIGRGLGNVSQGRGFFQSPDAGLQKVAGVQSVLRSVPFDANNPAAYYDQVGRALQEAGYADIAPLAFQEARKLSVQDRELSLRERGVTATEEDVRERREAAGRKVSSEQTTTKGIRVFRRGDGPLQVEEDGQDVPYDPKKHGRFETAQDRMSTGSGLTRQVDRLTGRVIIRDKNQNIVRIEPASWETAGPATTTPGTPNNSAGRGGVRTVDQLLKDLNQK